MHGGLMDLVMNDVSTSRRHFPSYVSDEIITLTNLENFGEHKETRIEKHGDSFRKIYLQVRLRPAPEGYRWKKNWPMHFIENVCVDIDNNNISDNTAEFYQMSHLMFKNPKYHISNKFDYNDNERTIKSKRCVETSIEIFSAFECFLIRIHPTSVIKIKLNSLDKILERIPDGNTYVNTDVNTDVNIDVNTDVNTDVNIDVNTDVNFNIPNLLESCDIRCLYRYYDTNDRSIIVMKDIVEYKFDYYKTLTQIISLTTTPMVPTRLAIDNHTRISAIYIWIRNVDGTEISSQIIKRLKVFYNGRLQNEFSGGQSQVHPRNNVPDEINRNIPSENIYYLSYNYPNNEYITDRGLDMHIIQNYEIEFDWNEIHVVPSTIKITMSFKMAQILRSIDRLCGLAYLTSGITITSRM